MPLFSTFPSFGKNISLGLWLKTDMHAHWLPGIDDGAKTTDDSLKIVQGLYNMGFRQLIATPHIYPDLYPNTPETIQMAFNAVAPRIQEQFPDLTIGFAAEYMVDADFPARVQQEKLLTWGNHKVLIEFSFLAEPRGVEDTIFKMGLKGYTPVLAHPERYPYYYQDLRQLNRFIDMGVELQVNALSLKGSYGPEVKKQAEKLYKKGLFTWMGTDCHHEGHLKQLQTIKIAAKSEPLNLEVP